MSNKKEKRVEKFFYDKHPDEEIWIIGSGPSIDDFPKDFFDDKISIALNGAIYKYPEATYWYTFHTVWLEKAMKENPEIFDKTFVSYMNHDKMAENRVMGNMMSLPYWVKVTTYMRDINEAVKETLEQIHNKEKDVGFSERGTVAHTAIEVAFLMGAKKITLAGCEHKPGPNGERHGDIGIKHPTPPNPVAWTYLEKPLIYTTNLLAKELKEYGVKVRRYYNMSTSFYRKGYEKI